MCKIGYTSARTMIRHEQGSMYYLDNKNECLSELNSTLIISLNYDTTDSSYL